jgi:hypothetical protein
VDVWLEHFTLEDAVIVGTTAIGRVTAALLFMNDPEVVWLRQTLADEHSYAPNKPS